MEERWEVFSETSVKVFRYKWSLGKWEEYGWADKEAFQERVDSKRSVEAEMVRVCF